MSSLLEEPQAEVPQETALRNSIKEAEDKRRKLLDAGLGCASKQCPHVCKMMKDVRGEGKLVEVFCKKTDSWRDRADARKCTTLAAFVPFEPITAV